MALHELAIYLAAFVGPFVQEDAAIVGAVTSFLHPEMNKISHGSLILGAMMSGLVISDLWKYWIGWAGRTQAWAQKTAARPNVRMVGAKIIAHPGKTLMFARFVPGTRIPAYIAAGFFGVPFRRFAFWIVVSAIAYVAVAVISLTVAGLALGKQGQLILAAALVVGLIGYMLLKKVATSLETKSD